MPRIACNTYSLPEFGANPFRDETQVDVIDANAIKVNRGVRDGYQFTNGLWCAL